MGAIIQFGCLSRISHPQLALIGQRVVASFKLKGEYGKSEHKIDTVRICSVTELDVFYFLVYSYVSLSIDDRRTTKAGRTTTFVRLFNSIQFNSTLYSSHLANLT